MRDRYVVNYYRTGHLHVMEELCEISFLQEIQYWGIDELRINMCCRERYYRRKEQKEALDVRRELEAGGDDVEDFAGAFCPSLRRRLWDLLEKPESSPAARTFGSLSVFFVVLSVVNMVLISLDPGEGLSVDGGGAPLWLDGLEYACVVWFTGELGIRFLCVRDKCRFSRSVPNLIDLLAVLPFYVTLAVESLHGGSTELENMGRVVQVLRLLRTLRMLKLGRHSTGKNVATEVFPQNISVCFRSKSCRRYSAGLVVKCRFLENTPLKIILSGPLVAGCGTASICIHLQVLFGDVISEGLGVLGCFGSLIIITAGSDRTHVWSGDAFLSKLDSVV